MLKKCVIITTVNKPSLQVNYYSKLTGWDLIIVADSQTLDSEYLNLECKYLSLKLQKELYPSLYDKIPLKSYTRKMFGYLYAIHNKYDIIYDTDDDNNIIGDIDTYYKPGDNNVEVTDTGFVNIYKLFTDSDIWPRGIPPEHPSVSITPTTVKSNIKEISIIQGLVNNDPDVDAVYRLKNNNHIFNFDKKYEHGILLNKNSVCPFNSQNTFWIDKSMFYTMYLPITVTFRYTDILRSIVAIFQLYKHDKTIQFIGPSAIQLRNEHDLNKDFESELPMYQTIENVVRLLDNNRDMNISDIYNILFENNITLKDEADCLTEWLRLINSV